MEFEEEDAFVFAIKLFLLKFCQDGRHLVGSALEFESRDAFSVEDCVDVRQEVLELDKYEDALVNWKFLN